MTIYRIVKRFSAVFAAILLAALCSTVVFAAAAYTEGTLYYTIENESITITGCFGTDETVEVPSMIAGVPVNTIATGAFVGNPDVKTVILPDNITSIQEGAFDAEITIIQKVSDSVASGIPADSTDATTVSDTETEEAEGNTFDSATVILQDGADADSAAEDGALDEAEVVLDVGELFEEEFSEEAASPEETASAAEPEDEEPEDTEPEAEAEPESNSTAVFVICGIVIVAAAAVAVFAGKKKKKSSGEGSVRSNQTKTETPKIRRKQNETK